MSIESLYYSSPKTVQEIMISIRSWMMRHKYVKPESAWLIERPVTPDAVQRYRELSIQAFELYLRYACSEVPFYQGLIASRGMSSTEVTFTNYKDIIPIIDKEFVRANRESLKPEKTMSKRQIISTSGTTGKPLRIYTDIESRKSNYLFFNSLLIAEGVSPYNKSIVIGGKRLFKNNTNSTFWRLDYYSNTLYMSNFHLNGSTVSQYLKKIEDYDPSYIESYPHPITVMAKQINRSGRKYGGRSLKVIITSSESLSRQDRKEIESAFGVEVINQYGNVEMSVFGFGANDTLYFPGLYGQLEFIPNEKGMFDIVSSGIINKGMCLLRYKTGDQVTKVYENDASGSKSSLVEGREEDYIICPDGTKITQFNPIVGVENVIMSQVVQISTTSILITCQTTEAFNNKDKDKIKKAAQTRLPEGFSVCVEESDNFRLTEGGKFKFILRLID